MSIEEVIKMMEQQKELAEKKGDEKLAGAYYIVINILKTMFER